MRGVGGKESWANLQGPYLDEKGYSGASAHEVPQGPQKRMQLTCCSTYYGHDSN